MKVGSKVQAIRVADVLAIGPLMIWGAVAQALPERMPAASSGTMNNLAAGGIDPRSGTPWAYYDNGLGMQIHSKAHRTQVMKDRGLRELAPGEVENEQRLCSREHDQHEANLKTYDRVLEDTGSVFTAMEQTFPDVEV